MVCPHHSDDNEVDNNATMCPFTLLDTLEHVLDVYHVDNKRGSLLVGNCSMLPPAVVEQQAKLGVPAEESKAERLKRQQARFRDRGGAFVPSNSNPLIDILLARTVSGESPSKPRHKNASASRRSPSSVQAIAGSSKPKPPTSRKRKPKAIELQADAVANTAPKRRGRPPKGKKKEPECDTEQQLPKTTSKTKGNVSSSAIEGKPKPKAKTKPTPAKKVVEVLSSDDDQTLVEVPPKASKRNLPHEDNGETDDDAPLIRKCATSQVHPFKTSGTKTTSRVTTEKKANTGKAGKKNDNSSSDAKKRPVPQDDDDDLVPPAKKKKEKVTNTTSAKPASAPASEVKARESIKATGTAKGKGRTEPSHGIARPAEDGDEQPPGRVAKAKKRKKEEDNYDDRPRKVVKFSESGPSHSSSRRLKENLSDGKHKNAIEPGTKDKPFMADSRSATKPSSRAKSCKGPPREVLERIKASAARHLRCADSEPDELDCLS